MHKIWQDPSQDMLPRIFKIIKISQDTMEEKEAKLKGRRERVKETRVNELEV